MSPKTHQTERSLGSRERAKVPHIPPHLQRNQTPGLHFRRLCLQVSSRNHLKSVSSQMPHKARYSLTPVLNLGTASFLGSPSDGLPPLCPPHSSSRTVLPSWTLQEGRFKATEQHHTSRFLCLGQWKATLPGGINNLTEGHRQLDRRGG